MIEGVERKDSYSDTHKTTAAKENTRMSLSHLLLHGYVIDEVVDGNFRAKFRSLRVEEVQQVNRDVIHVNGPQETRASTDMRNNKIISKSLMNLSVKDEAGVDLFNKDFMEMTPESVEDELRKVSAMIYNKVFAMYMLFEDRVSKLIRSTEAKN